MTSRGLAVFHLVLWAGTTGLTDPAGGAVPKAKVTVTSTSQGTARSAASDSNGRYSFPSLPVGEYSIKVEMPGFRSQRRIGLMVDLDSAIVADVTLELAEKVDEVTVAATARSGHPPRAGFDPGMVAFRDRPHKFGLPGYNLERWRPLPHGEPA